MIHLSNRAVLRISGADAVTFLQGLTTNDVAKVAQGELQYSLMLTPQGKYLFDFFLTLEGGDILLDCEAVRADDLAKKLRMYKLRSDVQIERAELRVYAGEGLADPRSEKLKPRLISQEERKVDGDLADYSLNLLENGIPDSTDFIVDKTFPMFYRLEDLNAVSFDKGCYVGQENTARMKYKGELRKSLFVVRGGDLPAFGEKLEGLGIMLSSQGSVGLALCDIDAVADYDGELNIDSPIY